MTAWLTLQGEEINRNRVQRLMRKMGLKAIDPKPRLSAAGRGYKILHPYELHSCSPLSSRCRGGWVCMAAWVTKRQPVCSISTTHLTTNCVTHNPFPDGFNRLLPVHQLEKPLRRLGVLDDQFRLAVDGQHRRPWIFGGGRLRPTSDATGSAARGPRPSPPAPRGPGSSAPGPAAGRPPGRTGCRPNWGRFARSFPANPSRAGPGPRPG
ncbi:MAG: IS3 family transposase [Planctomycetaceae bacterium]|nr:IS3 family transposase [Planctomycetaceae bacterium]